MLIVENEDVLKAEEDKNYAGILQHDEFVLNDVFMFSLNYNVIKGSNRGDFLRGSKKIDLIYFWWK